MSISTPRVDWWQQLQTKVVNDPFFESLGKGTNPTDMFSYRDGVWFDRGKIYLSPASSLLQDVMKDCHSSPIGEHFGYHKTLSRLKLSFSWPQTRGSVKAFLRSYDVCHRFKSDSMRLTGLLQPLSIPERVWTEISMDFINALPPSNGHTVGMVVVDRLSKYAHFVPMKHPYTTAIMAQAFVSQIIRLHGIPFSIDSDKDPIFLSSSLQALFKL